MFRRIPEALRPGSVADHEDRPDVPQAYATLRARRRGVALQLTAIQLEGSVRWERLPMVNPRFAIQAG